MSAEPATADLDAFDALYHELHRIAAVHLSRGAARPSLQPTLLVNEAWLKLSGKGWRSRTHFLALASRTMRMLLIDALRARGAQKRERGQVSLHLTPAVEFGEGVNALPIEQVIEVDRALDELAAFDARKASVVEMRFFGGLELPEIAEALEISLATVKRDWEFSRAWLFHRLGSAG